MSLVVVMYLSDWDMVHTSYIDNFSYSEIMLKFDLVGLAGVGRFSLSRLYHLLWYPSAFDLVKDAPLPPPSAASAFEEILG